MAAAAITAGSSERVCGLGLSFVAVSALFRGINDGNNETFGFKLRGGSGRECDFHDDFLVMVFR